MIFTFELYRDEKTGTNSVFVNADDGASGAQYPYQSAKEIGERISEYLENYYPDIVMSPEQY